MRGFYPARMASPGGTGIFPARWYPTNGAATFKRGEPVVATTGLIAECGADPALILGMANEDALSGPGYNPANSTQVLQVTNLQAKSSVTIAGPTVVFMGEMVNNSDTTITPGAADVEAEYGITAQTSGWAVDKNKTGASARVHIVDYDAEKKLVFFKVLTANCQEP